MTLSATKKMVDALGRTLEEREREYEIIEAANKEARENWDDPNFRSEVAAELTESIVLGFETETLVDRWLVTERTDFNGRLFVSETRGLKAFYMARGARIEQSQLLSENIELPRDMVGVHVSEFEDKLQTNFSETVQTLRNLAIQRMDAEINRRIHTLLQESVPQASPYYAAAAGLSKPAVDAALRNVRDTSREEVVIVGRSTMTDQIADFDGFSNDTLTSLNNTGVLGRYRGATIISLRNFKDEDDTSFFPANELWVMGKDAGKFGFYGGLKAKEFQELDNWYWHYLARRDTGVMIHHPERTRRLVDTSITP